jgi:hypothetical protein
MTTENKWQKIETAPKDGTHILLIIEDKGIDSDYYITEGYYYETGWQQAWILYRSGCDCDSGTKDPTYWMPLPRPPITKKEGE